MLDFDTFIKKRVIRLLPLLIVTSVAMYALNIVLVKNNLTWSCATVDFWTLITDNIFAGKATVLGGHIL